jgi:octaprenyl-diphosphate synthase
MKRPPSVSAAPSIAGSMAGVFSRLGPTLDLVERTLRDQLTGETNLIVSLGGHVLSSGGKRLRPALLLLTAELCGYTGPRRVQVAAAIELLHTATLLHDDVVDCSELRRGRPSANSIWGNRRAVLAGDFFYARASNMIIEDGSLEILERFAETIRLMAEGELLQLEFSFDVAATEAQYYRVIDRKSAALLRAACEAGAILGGVTRAERRSLSEFGRELGLAFQLRDDALDYESAAETLGKPRYADLVEGKVTLPLLLTLKRCAGGERERIAGVLKRARQASAEEPTVSEAEAANPICDDDLAVVAELVSRYRGVVDTARRADQHVSRARDAIAAFPDCAARQALLAAAEYAAARDR